MRASLAAALAAFLVPGVSMAQSESDGLARSTSFAVELRVGGVLESQPLGTTTGVSDGYFGLGEVEAAPMVGLGLVLPETVLGIRPLFRVSYATAADVAGNWFPCDPGFACPDVLLPVDGSTTRLEGAAGAQLSILRRAGPIRPYVSASVGLRRYGLSWEPIGGPGGFQLEAGSLAETELLGRFGLGTTIALGRFEALIEGAADFSSFGAGRVPVPEEPLAQWARPTIDLGRESVREYEVVVGLRRILR